MSFRSGAPGQALPSELTRAIERAGYYPALVGDVVRTALRLLEDRETRLRALRRALISGEQSGESTALNDSVPWSGGLRSGVVHAL